MRTARWIFPSRDPQAWGWSRGEPGRRGKRLMEETGPGVTRCRVSNQTAEQVFERVATHRSSGASLARTLGLMPAYRYWDVPHSHWKKACSTWGSGQRPGSRHPLSPYTALRSNGTPHTAREFGWAAFPLQNVWGTFCWEIFCNVAFLQRPTTH